MWYNWKLHALKHTLKSTQHIYLKKKRKQEFLKKCTRYRAYATIYNLDSFWQMLRATLKN